MGAEVGIEGVGHDGAVLHAVVGVVAADAARGDSRQARRSGWPWGGPLGGRLRDGPSLGEE